ncbi:MAG: aminotransferase class III-fold pyridoxal phosphate-dependent enzyme [Pseudomonadota bacterium]
MSVHTLPNSLEEYWMPFTSNRHFKASPRMMTGASGMYYTTHQGAQVIDGSSGLFCVGAGHGRREIADAAHKALLELDHVPPFQYGHPQQFELARRLARITPGDLNHIFFTNSGSESVDTALKVALAYHKARGEGTRTRFIGRQRAYHGVNFGGLSVAGMGANKKAFNLALPGVAHMRHTALPEHNKTLGQPETGADLADDLLRMVETYGAENIAACIVEPMAGSTGCFAPPVGYLDRLREICDAHGILLIFDEVICGFGRTGHQFGADAFGVTPDIMTMAKALTNGVVPMGAVACRDGIYDDIVDSAPEWGVEFMHGYTYSGSPVAVAAALATRDIFENEDLVSRAAALTPKFMDHLQELAGIPVVEDVRGYGLIGGLDIAPLDGTPGKRGIKMTQDCYDEGLMIKMTGDACLISPALIADEKHLDEIFTKLRRVLMKQ